MEPYFALLALALCCVAFSLTADDGVVSGGVLACALLLLGVLRFETGFDYQTYYEMVRTAHIPGSIEPLARAVLELFHALKLYWIGVSIFSALTIVLLWRALRDSGENAAVGLFVYLCVPVFFLGGFSTIRQHLAISFLALAATQVDRRSTVPALLTCILAVMFHKSAVLFALPILAYRWTSRLYPLPYYVAAGGVALLLVYALDVLVDSVVPGYAVYLRQAGTHGRSIGLLFGGIALALLAMRKSLSPRSIRYFNLYFLGTVGYCALMWVSPAAARVGLYGLVFLCWLIPDLVRSQAGSLRVRSVLGVGFFASLFVYYLYSVRDGGGLRIVPYASVLSASL